LTIPVGGHLGNSAPIAVVGSRTAQRVTVARIPAAIGVALAERDEGTDRKVIAIIGDGAANYVIQALWTAVQHKLDILFVIPRNSADNILKAFANHLHTSVVPGLDLPGLDFVSLAAGYGCPAERVSELANLDRALERGIATPGPHVIEIEVEP
jgi:benzoylformate decarboxylase